LSEKKKVVKSKEVKTGRNQVESFKENYGSNMAGLPVMMMINEREAAGGMISDRRKRITGRKPAPVPLIHSDEGTSREKNWSKDKEVEGQRALVARVVVNGTG
jgi:hypothetical protein